MDIANPQLKIRKKRKRLLLAGGSALRETLAQVTAAWAGIAVKYAQHASRMPGECPALLRAKGI